MKLMTQIRPMTTGRMMYAAFVVFAGCVSGDEAAALKNGAVELVGIEIEVLYEVVAIVVGVVCSDDCVI
jgi:hypothetical protein